MSTDISFDYLCFIRPAPKEYQNLHQAQKNPPEPPAPPSTEEWGGSLSLTLGRPVRRGLPVTVVTQSRPGHVVLYSPKNNLLAGGPAAVPATRE